MDLKFKQRSNKKLFVGYKNLLTLQKNKINNNDRILYQYSIKLKVI